MWCRQFKIAFSNKKRVRLYMLFYKNTIPFSERVSKIEVLSEVIWNPFKFKSKSNTRLREAFPSFDMWLLLKLFEGLLIFANWAAVALLHCHRLCSIKCQNLIAWWQRRSACTLEHRTRTTNKSSEIPVAESVQNKELLTVRIVKLNSWKKTNNIW